MSRRTEVLAQQEIDRLRKVLAVVEEMLAGGAGGYTTRAIFVMDVHRAMNAAGRTETDSRTRWGTRPG